MITEITSLENSLIKHVKQLAKRKYRERHNQYIIEGVRIVSDALENGQSMESILFCEELFQTAGGEALFQQLHKHGFKIYHITNRLYGEISETESPQGIMAILSKAQDDLAVLPLKDNGFYVLIDRVQDPGNMGTIIRTADAAGADAIFVSKGTVDLYNPKTIRATMGSIFHVPILQIEDTQEILAFFRDRDIQIITTSLEGTHYHYEVDYKQSFVAIVGNEANGVSSLWLEQADLLVKIPLLGKAESLNASIAAAIVFYEAVRQRN
ncbi:MAG: RNA methyltransferase [Thermotaleaceae bacterium]